MDTDQFTAQPSHPGQVVQRQVSRVLLLRDDRVLLLRGHDPAEPSNRYWFTIGGTIEDSETPREAATRKLREDVGVEVDPEVFDQPIWCNTTQFSHNGLAYRQYQRFYSLCLDRITGPAPADDSEYQHWWSVPELRATGENFYPVELPDLLDRIGDEPE